MPEYREFVDDIEDLVSINDIDGAKRPNQRNTVIFRNQFKKRDGIEAICTKSELSNMPGMGKIYVKTWGCTHNTSDSEYMAGMLTAYGYEIVNDKYEADLWLLNSCTVKNPAEDHFRNEINAAKKLGKFLVLAGCVPQGAPKSDLVDGFSIIGVQQIDRIVEVVEETLNGNIVQLFGVRKENGKKTGGASLNLPKIRRNPLIEIIAINTGCLNQCTYCKTKHARGNLGSYPIIDIVSRAKQAFDEGVVEIWLTSEDTGTYGRDIGTNLPTLMWQLIEVIPEGCRLRIGMTNPPYILEHVQEMVRILNHPRIYKFLHVPVQSGSDSVLMDMKREYCRDDFEYLVDYLRERVAGITIATDIICGFPTETDADFAQTMSLCEKYRFSTLFINQFYPRPGTPAFRMQKLAAKLVKSRTKQLSDWFRSYEPYNHNLGKQFLVLITETMADKSMYVGHNDFYEQILIPFDKFTENPMGKMVSVRVVKCTKFSMIGEPAYQFLKVPQLSYRHLNYNYLFFGVAIVVLLRFVSIIFKSDDGENKSVPQRSLSGGTTTPGPSSVYREELQTMLNNSRTNDSKNFYSVLLNNEKRPDYDTNEIKMKLNYYMADKKVFKDHKYYKRRSDNNRPFLLTINDIFTSPMNLKATKALISLSKMSKEHPFTGSDNEFRPRGGHVTRSKPLDLSKNGTDEDNDSNTSFEHDSSSLRETSQVTTNTNSTSLLYSSNMSILEPKIEITYESDSLPNETVA